MVEINLEEFSDFYKEKLNQLFFKVKRVVKKVIDEINADLVGIKLCMDHFLEISEKIDQKSLRSLNLFSERIKSYVDEIKVPESDNEINYTNLNDIPWDKLSKVQFNTAKHYCSPKDYKHYILQDSLS